MNFVLAFPLFLISFSLFLLAAFYVITVCYYLAVRQWKWLKKYLDELNEEKPL